MFQCISIYPEIRGNMHCLQLSISHHEIHSPFYSILILNVLVWTSGYNLTINLPRQTGDILFPILDWMSRSDIFLVLSSLILAVNLRKIDTNCIKWKKKCFVIFVWLIYYFILKALPIPPNKISLLHMYMYINIASDC